MQAVAPEERWHLEPTSDELETSRSVEVLVGLSQVVKAEGKFTLERTRTRDVFAATTVTGTRRLADGKNFGEPTAAAWTFLENDKRKTGVPDSVRVAILVRREDDEPFKATVSLEADADIATSFSRFFRKTPLDNPVLFNPKAEAKPGRKGRARGVLNLAKVDLQALCDARMGTLAPSAQPRD